MDMMEKVGETIHWDQKMVQTFLGGEYSDERKAKREGLSSVSSI